MFGHGKFAPGEPGGRRLLAHELAHVVQQRTMAVPAGLVQRDPDTEAEVKAVISPNVELREHAAAEVGTQLDHRMQKRKNEITASLGELGDNPKTASARRKAEALKKDLAKDLDTILKEPDSKYVSSALRKDIVESAQRVKTQKLKLKGAEDQWAKYDPIFAGQDVAKALGKDSLTAADLKALIAQESGDLTKNEQGKGIAGIAQMGAEVEKRSGASRATARSRKRPFCWPPRQWPVSAANWMPRCLRCPPAPTARCSSWPPTTPATTASSPPRRRPSRRARTARPGSR